MISNFTGSVYTDVRSKASVTFAIVLLVLISLWIIAFFVRIIDGVAR